MSRPPRLPHWQEGYNDRVLRGEEDTWDVIRCILDNPIRKRLVDKVDDYPFWGSGMYRREQLLDFVGIGRRV